MPLTMRISEVGDFLEKTIPKNMSVLLVGSPGLGKTDVVVQVAGKIKYKPLVEYTAMSDPTDPKGIPFAANDRSRADLLPIGMMADIFSATENTLFFMDDIGNAPPAVQTAYMHILHSRSIAGRTLPDCVSVIAATNKITDKSNVHGMAESAKSRFTTILHVENTPDDFVKYAMSKPDVFSQRDISFIRSRPQLLHDFHPTKDFVNSPCPRTWENTAKFFRMYEPDLPPMAVIAGSVGEGAAAERMGYERIYESIPDVNLILKDPEKAPVPSDRESDIKYALCGMLGRLANKMNAKSIFAYFERLGPEFSIVGGKDAVGFNPGLVGTRAFKIWQKAHPEITMN